MVSTVKAFNIRLVVPRSWRIEIDRVGEDMYELRYVEVVERPSNMPREMFESGVKHTVALVKTAGLNVSMEIQGDKATITVTCRGRLEVISSMIVSEFLTVSRIGDLTLREMLIASGATMLGKPAVAIPKQVDYDSDQLETPKTNQRVRE